MNKIKSRLVKGLAGFLLAGTLFSTNLKAQERRIIDNFSQPNDTTLNYYGSGDVFLDNQIDEKDAYRLDSIINSTFSDFSDERLLDRADINGDGIINLEDKQILENYLNKNISYLPGNHNKSKDRYEKIDWIKKMILIDSTDKHPYGSEGWLCGEFAMQNYIVRERLRLCPLRR